MPIETNCPSCGRLLRVQDEHAGRQARCPVCNSIYVVPSESDVALDEPSAPADDRWYMKTPEQQVFGPVSQNELQKWLNEGRISAACQLRPEGDDNWHPASDYFGILRTSPAPNTSNPFNSGGGYATSRPTSPNPYGRGVMLLPHRGGLILALGILGWVLTCPILSVAAWMMGNSDLREMRYERMDPSGQGLTQAGQVLGMVYCLLWLAGMLLLLFFAAFAMVG